MKKGLLVTTLTAVSALALAGCAKTVSYEEAKKHCNDNYTSNEVKQMNAHTKDEVKKADGIFATVYKVGVTEKDNEIKATPLAAAELPGESATYKVDGKKLSVSYESSVAEFLKEYEITIGEGDTAEGSVYAEFSVDDNGFPTSSFSKIDLTFSVTQLGITVSGALTLEETVTYSAK